MTEIVIHRCSLRVVRRDGWSWGPQPKRLLERAMEALPELIASRLGEIWPDDESREIAAPVRITVPVTIDELASVGFENTATGRAADGRSSVVASKISQAFRSALIPGQLISSETETDLSDSISERETETDLTDSISSRIKKSLASVDGIPMSGVIEMLFRWHKDGVLAERLRQFSFSSLEAWQRALIAPDAQAFARVPSMSDEDIVRAVREIANKFGDIPHDAVEVVRRRLFINVVIAAELQIPPAASAIKSQLGRLLPVFELQTPLKFDRSIDDSSPTAHRVKQRARSLPLTRELSDSVITGDIRVSSALPFLMLGPLSRIGYLGALSANLEAAKLGEFAQTFATALAYKVLDPPERGWRRTQSSMVCATAFSALPQPLPDEDLHEFDRSIVGHLSPLDAALVGPLIEGHDATQPLLLLSALSHGQDGCLLVDSDGIFPFSWSSDAAELVPLMRKCGESLVLIAAEIAEPRLLASLDAANIRFITDAPPTRDEVWRSVRMPGRERWWTNDGATPESSLVKVARRMETLVSEANESWTTLSVERPIIRPDQTGELDRHLSVVAATALGTIAWELWRNREATAPHVALERFHDLDARVSFSSDHVRVMLALGRRHQDLSDQGFLEDVADVPWFGGRLLQFGGG